MHTLFQVYMRQIHFDWRRIVICSKSDSCTTASDKIIYQEGIHPQLSEIALFFDKAKEIQTLYIQTEDISETYRMVSSPLTSIDAAGGVVTNPDREYLMIFRNEIWDLPKGKHEEGEDISATAVREVEEECGITNLSLGKLICITDHTYHRDGIFYLKHTYWYEMEYNSNHTPTPQIEENITKVEWVSPEDLTKRAEMSYPSIKEVLSKIYTPISNR